MECNAANTWRGLVELIFPPRCFSCGEKMNEDNTISPGTVTLFPEPVEGSAGVTIKTFCRTCLDQFRFLRLPITIFS